MSGVVDVEPSHLGSGRCDAIESAFRGRLVIDGNHDQCALALDQS